MNLKTLEILGKRLNKRSGNIEAAYHVVAIALRDDGAMVHSVNLPTRFPDPKAHAEARVLRKAGLGATLYVLRFTRKGKLVMAKPCADCMKMITALRVKDVYYSDWDGNICRA